MGRHFLALSQAYSPVLPFSCRIDGVDVSVLRMSETAVPATTLSCALCTCVALPALVRPPGLLFLARSARVSVVAFQAAVLALRALYDTTVPLVMLSFAFVQRSAVGWSPFTS